MYPLPPVHCVGDVKHYSIHACNIYCIALLYLKYQLNFYVSNILVYVVNSL